jgi:hypothetical protein
MSAKHADPDRAWAKKPLVIVKFKSANLQILVSTLTIASASRLSMLKLEVARDESYGMTRGEGDK